MLLIVPASATLLHDLINLINFFVEVRDF
jgi:hypothetical protein